MVPSCLSLALSSSPCVGVSGSRSAVADECVPVAQLLSHRAVAAAVAGCHVPLFVGCAAGVDSFFRGCLPTARVFSVASFGSGRGAFAARSVALVRAVASGGGVFVSFPSSHCPVGLLPSVSSSRAFGGFGSGSWASLAFAVGSGVPCWVFAPFGVPSGWGFVAVGGGWFSFAPVAVQSSLF